MEPPANRHDPSSGDAITVAELLARYQGRSVPATRRRGTGDAVSVAALLRREGRGSHKADRPLLPRGHARVPEPPADPPRRNVRKATAAAGALFAATAILGPSVLDDGSGSSEPGVDTAVPLPFTDPSDRGAAAALVDAAASDGLVVAAVRQLFVDAVPSDVDTRAFDGAAQGDGQIVALRYPPTAGGPHTASAEPAVPPSPGTTQPGGAASPWPWGPSDGPHAPAPGSGAPGGGTPRGDDPGGAPGSPGPSGPSGVAVTLSPPALVTPAVHVPSAGVELPVVGPVRGPAVTVEPGAVTPPAVRAALGPDGVEAATTNAKIGVPDVAVSDVQVGALTASGTSVSTPDVEISDARVALSTDAPPEVRLPDVTISASRIETPDLALGPVSAQLPDVELPAVSLGTSNADEADAESGTEPETADDAPADTGDGASDDDSENVSAGSDQNTGSTDDTDADSTDADTDTSTDDTGSTHNADSTDSADGDDSGTDDSGTDDSGTDDSGTDDSGTDGTDSAGG